MEFDEMKKIWEAQNNQPLYVIDETVLLNHIQSKMSTVLLLTNISEWFLILIYLSTVCIMLALNPFKQGANVFMYLGATCMLITFVYLIISRIRRIKTSRRFDRSIHGDLDHSISLAIYQMRIAQLIRWGLLPIGAIMIFSGWESRKLFQVSAVIMISHVIAFYVASNGYHANKRRKRELQVLKEKLETANQNA
jgi:hypothetical protein